MTTKSKERVKDTGEVFTPRSLVRKMLDRLPSEVWFDPNKRWLEPAAGDGNFLVEIKARLLQAGHDEIHILENMLFSVELIDDNHWALQHRLGYLIDGQPNPALSFDNFSIGKISQLTQDLNEKNPYQAKIGLARDEVLFHRNHVCWSALDEAGFLAANGRELMMFGRTEAQAAYDDLFNAIFTQEFYEVEVTEDRLYSAAERAATFKDRKDQPRTEEKKLVDALMELAELPFKQLGAGKGEYDDASAAGSVVYGTVEVKSVETGTPHTSIRCAQAYNFMVVVERESTAALAKKVERRGIDILIGHKLRFYPKAVYRWTGQKRELCFQKLVIGPLGQWPETDTPDIGEKYVVEKMLGKQSQLAVQKVESPVLKSLAKDGKNPTKPVPVPKPPKPAKTDSKGGGWQVKAEWIGKGLKVKCKSPYDGTFWECDHDTLVEKINASLKAKGKPCIGEPGPSEKSYGSSSGLREQELWTRV